jgi:hypothetical protein
VALNTHQQPRAEAALRLVMHAAEALVAPRLREIVTAKMQALQRDVFDRERQADSNPDDPEAWAAFAALAVEQAADGSEGFVVKRLHENVPGERSRRFQYRSLPAWERTAAMYINFAHQAVDGVQHWDLTALCACMQNCGAFDAVHRAIVGAVRSIRNVEAHKNVCMPDDAFHEKLNAVETLLRNPALGDATPMSEAGAQQLLRPYRDGMERCMPARGSVAEARQYDQDQRAVMNLMTGQPTDRFDHLGVQLATLKLLTKDQLARFDELRNQQRPCRRLLEAPAGSGKTFIALKLIAHELREQQATARKHGVVGPPALLLVHTRNLMWHVLDELRSELGEDGSTAELREGLVRLELPHGVAAFVATVDGLCGEMAGGEAQTRDEVAAALAAYDGRVPRGGIGLAIVDEGHHARSTESNPCHASRPLSPPSRSDRGCTFAGLRPAGQPSA